jgi:hypothetical protein
MGDLRLLIYTGLVLGMFLVAPKGLYDIFIRVFRRVVVRT